MIYIGFTHQNKNQTHFYSTFYNWTKEKVNSLQDVSNYAFNNGYNWSKTKNILHLDDTYHVDLSDSFCIVLYCI